ncbi:hypothetical protein DMX11_16465 [Pseudomonas sp. LB-090624]|uniref:type II toxin-antitoxin system TacA family antitoxin n=1 Tax=Pseudomonas sp. LB-090624 TaxID=2213079 RepID=UPI000D866DC8|nr:DUF1778 domain-containing protein [Pseudomonas sp. LB-090624]PYB73465.1 hypothetical protein DMX11_16465 [Pseudomonas sp. LB-090624]
MSEIQPRDRSKAVPLNMRVAEHRRDLIDAAVEVVGGDRTSFVLEAACKRAEEVLMERRLFLLDDAAFYRTARSRGGMAYRRACGPLRYQPRHRVTCFTD